KTRLMNLCVFVVAITALICAVATSFPLLVAMRIMAGLVAGGVFPVAMALLGDLVPIERRQATIARLLGIAPTANVLGLGIGEVLASVAGLLVASFAIGGVVYSLFVPMLIGRVPERSMMVTGGAIAAASLVLISLSLPWQAQVAIFGGFGLGFYLLHSCIQLHVTDLSHTARGAAASLHSSSFYLGQALGPV